jgi:hypothetical protein
MFPGANSVALAQTKTVRFASFAINEAASIAMMKSDIPVISREFFSSCKSFIFMGLDWRKIAK